MKLKWLKATKEQCKQYNLPLQKGPYIAFYGTSISCTVAFRSHEGDWFVYCSITEANGIIIKKAFRSNVAEAKKFCENAVNGYLTRDTWQQELRQIIEKGCTDSVIEDFEDAHPEINGEDIWQFVHELDVPEACKGCVSVGWYPNFSPCNKCVRCAPVKDCYEPREDYIGSNKANTETVIKLRKALDILEEYRGYMPRDISHQIWKELTEDA